MALGMCSSLADFPPHTHICSATFLLKTLSRRHSFKDKQILFSRQGLSPVFRRGCPLQDQASGETVLPRPGGQVSHTCGK